MAVQLSARSEQVLKIVVEGYVSSAQPVGSGRVLATGALHCSPATVRNDMVRLMEAGYIEQPHTSAGRIPTDKGYRHYVDHLMCVPARSPRVRESIDRRLARFEGWTEAICQEACRMLLKAVGQAAIVVTSVASEAVIRHVHLQRVAPRTLVLMVAFSTGHVLHHSLDEATPLSAQEVARCGRLLRGALAGRTLAEARQALADLRAQMSALEGRAPLFGLLASLVEAPQNVQQVFFEGAALIAEAPELRHSAGLPDLLSLLDRGDRLGHTVLAVSAGRDFAVSIGKENPASEMRQCSLMLRTLTIREDPPTRATLAVLGPTRMDYPRIAGTLRDFAAGLPRWLGGR